MYIRRIASNKQPNIKDKEYLGLKSEPHDFGQYGVTPEVEAELMANRFFLKRRVWRNMDKIRRSAPKSYSYREPRNRNFRPNKIPV